MGNTEMMQLFENHKIRTAWNEDEEKWYFSIVDVVWVLTDQPDLPHARNYWKVLKNRLIAEGNQRVTNCNQLKLTAAQRIDQAIDPERSIDQVVADFQSPEELPFEER